MGEKQHLFFYADVTKIQKTRGSGFTRESSRARAYRSLKRLSFEVHVES